MAVIELFIPCRPRIDLKGWIGLLIGFSGVALLVLSGSGTGSSNIMVSAIILLAAACWAIGSVYSKGFTPTGSVVANIGVQMLAGGIGLCIVGSALGELGRISLSVKGIGAMLYLIVFGSLIGYSSYIYILQKWPAAKAGTYAYVNPPVAFLLGALVLGEPFTLTMLLSTVIILAGVLMVQLSKTKGNVTVSIKRDSSL